MKRKELERKCIDTLRFLAADAVQQANSGHPGAPMGMAPMAFTLWDRFLVHNPADPEWPDRDRFVLSAGHASMLLYGLLHLTGYDLPLDELKRFRQWGSRTPGHPEYGETPGVEMTTGPLGQGFAHGIGMAMAERFLADRYNRPGHEIVDHYTYALVSDGDLQEGISAEAAGLAGTLGLGKVIYLYDDNHIQIDGRTDKTFAEDVAARFRACKWHVVGPIDGFDCDAVAAAIEEAKAEKDKPSLVICRTIIGYGAPNQDTPKVHGSPLGEDGLKAAKKKLGWPEDARFLVPDEVGEYMRRAVERGREAQSRWEERFAAYEKAYPELARRFKTETSGGLPEDFHRLLDGLFDDAATEATRASSGRVINALADGVGNLVGGSADLAGSTKTLQKEAGEFAPGGGVGNNVHFGVREHAMGAIAGGMAVHGGIIPYTGTFLAFSDYMRGSIRLAALMGLRVVYVFTHDSIGLGEDGPTHQPVEQLMSLRMIPNLTVIRPADGAETAEAWKAALLRTEGPTALVLTRQSVPPLDRKAGLGAEGLHRGAYALLEPDGEVELVIMGSGSETALALEAGERLASEGVGVRVVSMASWELFDGQPETYRNELLPPGLRARIAVEAGTKLGWERYVGLDGAVVGMDGFGASAPADVLYEKFGITVDKVVEEARRLLGRS